MISPRSGAHDAPPSPTIPDLFTAEADRLEVEQIARPDLWCPRCRQWSRIEFDIVSLGVTIATVQGCPPCRSGIYADIL